MGEPQVCEKTTQQYIEELTDWVRQDERRKAQLAALLEEIKEGQSDERVVTLLNILLEEIRQLRQEMNQRLLWIEKYDAANYNYLVELLHQAGVDIQKDRTDLNGVQRELMRRALERESAGLKISAARDAIIEGDVGSGKDKKE